MRRQIMSGLAGLVLATGCGNDINLNPLKDTVVELNTIT
jgi:hypothetical protein